MPKWFFLFLLLLSDKILTVKFFRYVSFVKSVTSDSVFFLLSEHQTHNILWDLSLKQKSLSRQLCIYELSLTIVLRSVKGITASDKRVLTALPPASTLMLTAVLSYLKSRAKRRTRAAEDSKGLDTPLHPHTLYLLQPELFTY